MARVPALLRRMIPPRGAAIAREYDYVIVGAGSAGCLLANELSADPSKSVLLLEAGAWDSNPLIHIPAGVYSVFKDETINWNMKSEPEPAVNGRCINLPRGKVVGGSSAINAMVYMRGHPLDYDAWARDYDLPGWRFENCLPYFKRCETSDRGGSEYRGGEGRLMVTQGKMANPLYEALMKAAEQSGQGTSEDLNGYKPQGVARLDRTSSPEGRRCSATDAHLLPALDRPNLSLATGQLVERVEMKDGRATGVRLGPDTVVRAIESVVLSAGSIKTPQLLMLSGIGDRKHLAEHGVECVHHLPGVGQNLQDHACINIAWHCKKPGVSLDYLGNPIMKAAVGLRWLLGLDSPAASNIWEAGGLVFGKRHGPEVVGYPNLQYHMTPVFASYDGADLTLKSGFQIQIDQLRPRSRGTVTLKNNDPRADPAALFNYLADHRDMSELVDGYRTAQELLEQPAFDEFRGEPALPDRVLKTDEEIEAFVRATAGTDYHPCGTCRMGGDGDDHAVVDGELRVRGIEGLRVIDASVMPAVVSGNINGPTQMIAMRGADFLRGATQMLPERPVYHFDSIT